MKAQELRERFLNFFRTKNHNIVGSAPMVVKNDPTLMFTNAGMNQFKDIFLGNSKPTATRVANSQKCLRVSGKHNDLEEVGHDTYHHTMFEMLGNWSFGDYFKKEAIEWAWEFLTKELAIDKDRLYVTIFKGDKAEKLEKDTESYEYWAAHIAKERIIEGSKKDNFWEMGDTGPCGPCSEIHVDIRDDAERKKNPGKDLVNTGHPLVIEIWNLVFMQYNRKADGSLELLPAKHVDTGMGFERLCMVVQGKKSNYDTDIFQSVISKIAEIAGKKYGENEKWDTALRVIADHLRTVSFSIADGQLPSNNKAGYVIRRILRRAVRYGYTYLEMEEPFIHKLVPVLADVMGEHYPELLASKDQIVKIVYEEEVSFLRTLGKGLKMLSKILSDLGKEGKDTLPGKVAFELYDTFGFPLDLTQLILRENKVKLDEVGFNNEMLAQKERSRDDAAQDTGDWIEVYDSGKTVFTGYDKTEDNIRISKYRLLKLKGKEICQLVFDRTPFYAESGGQAGDTGIIVSSDETLKIINTVKENELIIHITEKVPSNPAIEFKAKVNESERSMTEANHSATHLIHNALRKVLGKHVEQKGSLVTPDRLRFDFSHFSKVTDDELARIENEANLMVRRNTVRAVSDGVSMAEAQKMGAMALFGEKYGESVRVISFGDSVELCGGTHVESSGRIGLIKIISETAIAAGIRRIEALTGEKALDYVNETIRSASEAASLLKNQGSLRDGIEKLIAENAALRKNIAKYQAEGAKTVLKTLINEAVTINGISFVSGIVDTASADQLKNIAFEIKKSLPSSVAVIGAEIEGKANIAVMVSDQLVKENRFNAVTIIKEISAEINGGGGGQPFLATAGGKNPAGLAAAIGKAETYIRSH